MKNPGVDWLEGVYSNSGNSRLEKSYFGLSFIGPVPTVISVSLLVKSYSSVYSHDLCVLGYMLTCDNFIVHWSPLCGP